MFSFDHVRNNALRVCGAGDAIFLSDFTKAGSSQAKSEADQL